MSENKIYDVKEIMKMIPHRYPFLLLDKLEIEEVGLKGIGTKNLTINEGFFQGHFPDDPIMPGVLQIEAMAQTAGCIVMSTDDNYAEQDCSVLFMSIDGVKFRKPVRPGDQLKMYLEKTKTRGNIFVFHGVSKVDGQVVSEADLTAMIVRK
ncbi:MAG: 3-hydroxyacyl-ACP dehydratase FabZ [Alphaproteobacteria bacterium]|nr:3-hydroxyacyl-ACP dehydratase FabZ [Alphaproteobacteria bacterium]